MQGPDGGHTIDSAQNGVLWKTGRDQSTNKLKFFFSTNSGDNWTEDATMDVAGGTSSESHIFIDLDDYMWLAWNIAPGGYTPYIYLRRGTPNAGRTSYTWGSDLTVFTGTTGYALNVQSLCVFREGAGWRWHVLYRDVFSNVCADATGYATTSTLSLGSASTIFSGGNGAAMTFHNTGDGKTVLNGTPHLYYTANGSAGSSEGAGVLFKKSTWTAGPTWTLGTLRTLVSVGLPTSPGHARIIFDGTRALIPSLYDSGAGFYQLRIYERDAADTTTTTRTPSPWSDNYDYSGSPEQVAFCSDRVSGDIYVAQVTSAKDLKLSVYSRGGNSWGSQVTLASIATVSYWTLACKSHDGGNALDISWRDGNTTKFVRTYITPPTPTALSPANGATVTTSTPDLNATVLYDSALRREFQFATDSGFTTGVLTFLEPVGTPNPSSPWAFPSGRLTQGTWYYRARGKNYLDVYGPWTATATITVSHTPAPASFSPAAGSFVQYAGETSLQVGWAFTDPDSVDTQSAYQVQLWKTSNYAGTVKDSGLVTSSNLTHIFTGIDSSWMDTELGWKVLVKDSDGISSGFSSNKLFYLRQLATIAISNPPAGGTITTPAPTVTWTFSGSGGRTQTQFKVQITNNLTGVLVADSGWVTSAATSWTVPTNAIVISVNHTVTLAVIDSFGVTTTTSNNFTAVYNLPAAPTTSVSAANFQSDGYNRVTWTCAVDATFVAWRVYRHTAESPTWKLLTTITASAILTYDDYTAPSNVLCTYAVVQVNLQFGAEVESAYVGTDVTPTRDYYMLICPDSPSLSMRLRGVNSESFKVDQERETIDLIGRGRRVEIGTRFGETGTIGGTFVDVASATARQQRLALEALRTSGLGIFLSSPFGDTWAVSLMEASIVRVPGVGMHEMAQYTIQYNEITDSE